jgi:acetylornithine/LysW-gamma-L-lysine aminotransferase
VSAAIPSGAHGTTFGGSPLACRAALVTLRAMRERDLYTRSTALGDELMSRLAALGSPRVRHVRGQGMMIGVELKERVTPTLRALQERSVLVLPAGATTFRLLPPLIWEQQQVDEFLAAAADVLA